MQSDTSCPTNNHNVINLFTGQTIVSPTQHSIIQICPESSGIKMLYANLDQPERLISVPILCWGMRSDGETVGIVPWVGEITDCTSIDKDFDIRWEGYYQENTETIFSEPPQAVVAQLVTAMRFLTEQPNMAESRSRVKIKPSTNKDSANNDSANNEKDNSKKSVRQEIPDLIGTHALILNQDSQSLLLTPVVSWVLDIEGEIHGMLVDEKSVEKTPVIPGDDCLYYAASHPGFCCYFQRDIADQIRLRNPETIAAIEKLLNQS